MPQLEAEIVRLNKNAKLRLYILPHFKYEDTS